jgi:hypothetical protein
VFDADFLGEVEAGAMLLVAKVRAAVNKRFQNGVDQPDVLGPTAARASITQGMA